MGLDWAWKYKPFLFLRLHLQHGGRCHKRICAVSEFKLFGLETVDYSITPLKRWIVLVKLLP